MSQEQQFDKHYENALKIATEWKDWIPYPDSTPAEWDRYNLAVAFIAFGSPCEQWGSGYCVRPETSPSHAPRKECCGLGYVAGVSECPGCPRVSAPSTTRRSEPTKEQRQAISDLLLTMRDKMVRGEEINWLAMPHEIWRALGEGAGYVPSATRRSVVDELLRPRHVRVEALDFHGLLWGIRFTDGCSNGCVELYLEDDDFWHLKATFDRVWLEDLRNVIEFAEAKNRADGGKQTNG